MNRIILIHWNAAEGEERAQRLLQKGHQATPLVPINWKSVHPFRENPPRAFVIDLSRLPSQGMSVALLLRQQKGTRRVPLVFVAGDPEKVARVRQLLPDATYTDWRRIQTVLTAIEAQGDTTPGKADKAKKVAVPGIMAGYSGTPLPKKLGIKAGGYVALLGAPPGFEQKLTPLPEGVHLHHQSRGTPDLFILFSKNRADLARRLPAVARRIKQGVGLWLAWPKQSSGVATDLTERIIQTEGLATGLVDYKICAIDETWSGLLFTERRAKTGSRSTGAPRSARAQR